jgi:hypothetical protein
MELVVRQRDGGLGLATNYWHYNPKTLPKITLLDFPSAAPERSLRGSNQFWRVTQIFGSTCEVQLFNCSTGLQVRAPLFFSFSTVTVTAKIRHNQNSSPVSKLNDKASSDPYFAVVRLEKNCVVTTNTRENARGSDGGGRSLEAKEGAQTTKTRVSLAHPVPKNGFVIASWTVWCA